MVHSPTKAPVRMRQRIAGYGAEQRLIADPAKPGAKKRLPNSGSMKKGETRNPNGRPKGAKGTKAMINKVLSQKTTVKEGGRSRRATLYHALLLKEVQLAFAGDWRARKTVLELGRWALPEESPHTDKSTSTSSSEADAAILAWFESEVLANKDDPDDEPE